MNTFVCWTNNNRKIVVRGVLFSFEAEKKAAKHLTRQEKITSTTIATRPPTIGPLDVDIGD